MEFKEIWDKLKVIDVNNHTDKRTDLHIYHGHGGGQL